MKVRIALLWVGEEVVTPIRTVLRAATGDCDPYAANVGVAYCITPYTTKVTQSRWIFATVTGSPAV